MELKLAKLPDRTPVKITITVKPTLNASLQTYAELYRETYGDSETVAELIPYMLQSFLDADRNFAKAFRRRDPGNSQAAPASVSQTTRPRRRDVPEGDSRTSN